MKFCLYAPGVRDKQHVAAMVRAVAPRPLNVLVSAPGLSLAELADLGVRRVSVGGARGLGRGGRRGRQAAFSGR